MKSEKLAKQIVIKLLADLQFDYPVIKKAISKIIGKDKEEWNGSIDLYVGTVRDQLESNCNCP